jgi:conjugal transfer/entry exclusion protein
MHLRRTFAVAALLVASLAAPSAHAQGYTPYPECWAPGDPPIGTTWVAAGFWCDAVWKAIGVTLVPVLARFATILQQLQEANALKQQALTGRPPAEVSTALNLLRQSQTDYEALVGDTSSMGYSRSAIHTAFTSLYPSTQSVETIAESQFDTLHTQEQTEVLAASEIADRAHTSVAGVETRRELAQTIVQNSSGLDSVAGQLQLGMQLAAVVQSDFTAQIQNLAMTGRALSDRAAGRAAARLMAHERMRRSRLNYTARGSSLSIPTQWP